MRVAGHGVVVAAYRRVGPTNVCAALDARWRRAAGPADEPQLPGRAATEFRTRRRVGDEAPETDVELLFDPNGSGERPDDVGADARSFRAPAAIARAKLARVEPGCSAHAGIISHRGGHSDGLDGANIFRSLPGVVVARLGMDADPYDRVVRGIRADDLRAAGIDVDERLATRGGVCVGRNHAGGRVGGQERENRGRRPIWKHQSAAAIDDSLRFYRWAGVAAGTRAGINIGALPVRIVAGGAERVEDVSREKPRGGKGCQLGAARQRHARIGCSSARRYGGKSDRSPRCARIHRRTFCTTRPITRYVSSRRLGGHISALLGALLARGSE